MHRIFTPSNLSLAAVASGDVFVLAREISGVYRATDSAADSKQSTPIAYPLAVALRSSSDKPLPTSSVMVHIVRAERESQPIDSADCTDGLISLQLSGVNSSSLSALFTEMKVISKRHCNAWV